VIVVAPATSYGDV